MKKAEEFLIDTQLGEKKFDIKLGISGAVPPALPSASAGRFLTRLKGGKSLYHRLDQAVRAYSKVKGTDIAAFYRLLSVMINAGIPLVKSLDVIADQTLNARLKKTVYEIARAIERGGNLSGAMASFPKVFEEAQVGMVRSGEASGQLNRVLLDLALEVEKSASIKRKIKGAMIYPIFIITVLILVVIGMLVFVIPKMSEVFASTGQKLPALTRGVLAVSHFVSGNLFLIIAVFFGCVFGIHYGKKTRFLKRPFDEVLLYIPVLGQLLKKSILARFSRSLGNLLKSGIPIIETLTIASKGVGNEVYRERIILAAEDISRGIPLAESFRDSPLFPSLMTQMIAVGEQTAQLDTISLKIAEYYEDEFDTVVQSFTKVLEPIILLLVGGTVGVIVAAIMLPIIQLITVSESL